MSRKFFNDRPFSILALMQEISTGCQWCCKNYCLVVMLTWPRMVRYISIAFVLVVRDEDAVRLFFIPEYTNFWQRILVKIDC